MMKIRIIKVGFLMKFVEYLVFLIVLFDEVDFGYIMVFMIMYRIFLIIMEIVDLFFEW